VLYRQIEVCAVHRRAKGGDALLDIRTLKTFCTVVKHQNFHKAAEELAYAQSTITMQIKKLEEDLGICLLHRGRQGFQLTEAGRYLYEHAEQMVQEMEQLREGIKHIRTGEAGFIRLGVMEPFASYRLPIILKSYIERYPRVHLSLQIHSNQALGNLIRQGELDAAICTLPDDLAGLHYEKLLSEQLALLMPEDHPLVREEIITLPMLLQEQLLITSSVCPFRRTLEQAMMSRGLVPKYRMEVSNMLAVQHYVAAGYGIAAVPVVSTSPPPQGCVLRPLRDSQLAIEIHLLYPRQPASWRRPFQDLITAIRSSSEVDERCPV
jgi:DNA-binding transcriptional LysR family regulator